MKRFCRFFAALLLLSSVSLHAEASISQVNQEIQQLLSSGNSIKNLPGRINYFGSALLGKKYTWFPLGEGPRGRIVQRPLYQLEEFDCLTYVETVLALAFAKNLDEFQEWMKKLRYQNGAVSFPSRNHFMEVDWLANNEKLGVVTNITEIIAGSETATASAYIDKKSWYRHMTEAQLYLPNATEKERKKALTELHGYAENVKNIQGKISYIPLTVLLSDKEKKEGYPMLHRIPDASIIFIVRPNWNLKEKIGTNLNVSHLGFIAIKGNQVNFRNASSIKKKTFEVDLIDYLKPYYENPKATVKGISVIRVNDLKV